MRPGVKGPRLPAGRAGDAHRTGPGRPGPVDEREVRAAGGHGRQAFRPGRGPDGLDPLHAPVGDAPAEDLPFPLRRAEHPHHRLERGTGEVAVEEVEIEPLDPQPPKARLEVGSQRVRGQPVRTHPRVGMSALADEEEPVPETPGGHPLSEQPLGSAQLVGGGEVEGAAARLHQRVERAELLLAPRPPGEPVGEHEAQARRAGDHGRNHGRGGGLMIRGGPPPEAADGPAAPAARR